MKSRYYNLLLAGPLIFTWLMTWRHLASEWSTNVQYQYGFAVPLLSLYLAWRNWPRPMPPGSNKGFAFYFLAWPVLVLATLLRLADPIWRLTGALWMVGATLVTFGYLVKIGGPILVRRMLFPLCFAWLGLPWPMPLENGVVESLTRCVAGATTWILNLAGIAALQRGNTIELSRQIVGIDAACSGIESLQASLMASVFLWGAMKLRVRAGLTLVAAGMACSIGVNFFRVLFLTCMAYVSNTQSQTIHNWVGNVASALIFAALFLVARSLRGRKPQQECAPFLDDTRSRDKKATIAWPGAALLCAGFLSIPLIAGFVLGPKNQTLSSREPMWQIDTRHLPPGWITREIEPTGPQRSMLQFSRWTGFQVRTPDGRWADVIHLFWAGNRGIPSMAFYHTPALCMPAAGWQLIGEPQPLYLEAGGESVPFMSYLLDRDTDRVLVLQYMIRGQRNDPFLVDSTIGGDRLDRLAELGRYSLEPVREEILIYLPHLDSGSSDAKFAGEIFSQVVKPVCLPPKS